jgi:membrane associated rhomboid family serine protease
MNTSADSGWSAILYVVAIVLAVQTMLRLPRPGRPRAAFAVPSAALWLLVAVPSLVQRAVPGLYDPLHREPDEVLRHGQWWRVVTSIVVQDGGWSGTVFNLVVLALVLPLAVAVRGGRFAAVTFWGLGTALNVLAVLAGAPAGGGNSGATFALAFSALVLAWTARAGRLPALLAAGAVVVAVALVALDDAHGVAMLCGAGVGVLFDLRRAQRLSSASRARVNA